MFNFLNDLRNFVQQPGSQQVFALLAVATSLIIAIISPMVTLYVTRRQIRATVVSANRQKWIDSLRETIAELMAIVYVAEDARVPASAEINTKAHHLRNKILLLTNPTESDHVELNRLVEELVVRPFSWRQDETGEWPANAKILVDARKVKNISDLQQEIVEVSGRILKSEWNRVRKGN